MSILLIEDVNVVEYNHMHVLNVLVMQSFRIFINRKILCIHIYFPHSIKLRINDNIGRQECQQMVRKFGFFQLLRCPSFVVQTHPTDWAISFFVTFGSFRNCRICTVIHYSNPNLNKHTGSIFSLYRLAIAGHRESFLRHWVDEILPTRESLAYFEVSQIGSRETFAFCSKQLQNRTDLWVKSPRTLWRYFITTIDIQTAHADLYTCAYACVAKSATSGLSDHHNRFDPICIVRWTLLYYSLLSVAIESLWS